MSADTQSWLKKQIEANWKKAGGVLCGSAVLAAAFVGWKTAASKHDNIPMVFEDKWHFYFGHFLFVMEINQSGKVHHEWAKGLLTTNEPCLACTSALGPGMVFLLDSELVKFVFEDQFDLFEKPEVFHERFHELFGDGIFVSNGEEWKFHRKTAARMFSMRNLKDYMFECAVSTAERCMKKLHQICLDKTSVTKDENLTSNVGVIVDINDILGRLTLDSFIEISFGKSLRILETFPLTHEFSDSFDYLINHLQARRWDYFWQWKKKFEIGNEKVYARHYRVISQFVDTLIDIDTRRKLVDESGNQTHDLLSLYMKHNPNITRQELCDVALNMTIAGRDTTRTLLSWFLFVVHDKPDVKAKIIQEINDMGNITYENLNTKLKYLEGALLETLRLYPSVPMLIRMAKQDVQLPTDKKYIVRKGDIVMVHVWTQTRNPKYFADPLKFDPTRWTEKGVQTFPPHIFPQFNIAPRLCLGRAFALLEAKIFICHFFKNFEYTPVSTEEPLIEGAPLLNIRNGYPIYLTPIHN